MTESVNFEDSFKRALKSLEKAVDPTVSDPTASVDIPTTQGIEDGGPREKVAKVTAINLFQHPEAHPVVLDLALLRKYGAEWLYWDVETLDWRIPQDFRTTDVSDLSLDKIQAMKTLHLNDNFWLQWEVFNWCVHPMNNLFPNFEMMQVPSVAQMMVAISTAANVRADVAWSDEVKAFMATVCKFDGIFCPPQPIEFLDVSPDNDLLNCEDIRKNWVDVKREDKMPTAETITAEQLRRMLEAHRFLDADRARLQEQMVLVLND